jgi:stearoyl-CoA desaturase (delta-9 desaturase)
MSTENASERSVPLLKRLQSIQQDTKLSSALKLSQLLNSLPRDVFERSTRKAIVTLVLPVLMITIGTVLIHKVPWFLLPGPWFMVALAACGLFACGYSCSQESFFNTSNTPRWINSIVGQLSMLVLLYPYESFKRLNEQRVQLKLTMMEKKSLNEKEEQEQQYGLNHFVSYLAQSPFWFCASAWEWINTNIYLEGKTSVVVNALSLYLFAGAFFSLMVYFGGMWTLFKYYLMPWIMYHFVMSTFLKVNEMDTMRQDTAGTQITCFPGILELLTNCATNSYVVRFRWKDNRKKIDYESDDDESDEEEDEENKEQTSELFESINDALSSIVPAYNLRRAKAALLSNIEGIRANTFSFNQIKDMISSDSNRDSFKYSNVDWVLVAYLLGSIIGSLYGAMYCQWYLKTWILMFVGYYAGGISITAGYHRLFSHKSYDAHWIVRWMMVLVGTSTFQGPVLSWCSDHRVHHRYTDTNKDPYNIKRGFFYAHMGWLMLKRESKLQNVEDLEADPVIKFQYDHYPLLGFIACYCVPALIAGLCWGDWLGGFFIAGVFKTTFLQHCTFTINSLAHTWGEPTFTDHRSARDSYLVSLVSFGEGYHNFHHEFPFDYRNGLKFYHYDPGKWLISVLHFFGLAGDLKRFDATLFEKGYLQMQQRKLDEQKKKFNWGVSDSQLKEMEWEEFQMMSNQEKKRYIIVNGIVHEITQFIDQHPGGRAFIELYAGKDATEAFLGGSYNHSNAARNILATMRSFKVTGIPVKSFNKKKIA